MSDMNVTQLVEEIGVYVENCKGAGMLGGGSMIKVNRDELLSMLDELRDRLPVELAESKQIIRTRESIIAEARAKAEQIVNDAAQEAGIMIDDNEIVALANMRAEEIVSEAQAQADQIMYETKTSAYAIQQGALEYTQGMMEGLEDMYRSMIESEKQFFGDFVNKLAADHKQILENKREIDVQLGIGTRARSKEDFENQNEAE